MNKKVNDFFIDLKELEKQKEYDMHSKVEKRQSLLYKQKIVVNKNKHIRSKTQLNHTSYQLARGLNFRDHY